MISRFTYLFLFILLGVGAICSSFAEIVVEKVRLGQHTGKTRVVLEVSKAVSPKVFTLLNPNRVVLDFPEVKFKPDLSSVELPENGYVGKMRQGLFKPGVVRMVLDAKRSVSPRVFSIPASGRFGHRVVIDLIPRKGRDVLAPVPSTEKIIRLAPVVRKVKSSSGKDATLVVVIDPGHGGVDPGAIGLKKTREKDVVLSVAKKLKKELNKLKNVKVYLTREKDIFLKLDDRIAFAQRRDADIFVSLHADAHKVRSVRGGSVYVLSERSSDKEAARLAREANRGDLFAGLDISHESHEVQSILIDLTQRETMNRSSQLAQKVLTQMGKVGKLRKKEVLFGGFRVLKAPEIPSVLVELAYLSNPEEERRLRSSANQQKIAVALAKGISGYVNSYICRNK